MKLVYTTNPQQEVKVGDRITLDEEQFVITYFRQPSSPASSGKVTIARPDGSGSREYYVSIIGAEWIEREDRDEPPVGINNEAQHADSPTAAVAALLDEFVQLRLPAALAYVRSLPPDDLRKLKAALAMQRLASLASRVASATHIDNLLDDMLFGFLPNPDDVDHITSLVTGYNAAMAFDNLPSQGNA